MTDQAKVDFYLRHRTQIEEWTALRTAAQQLIDDALVAAVGRMGATGDVPAARLQRRAPRIAKLDVTRTPSPPSWIELKWSRSQLLTETGGLTWPELGVCVTPDESSREVRQRVRMSTEGLAHTYGLVAVGNDRGWWLWRRQLAPGPDPLVIDEYVSDCIGKFAELWIAMHVVIQRAIEDVAESQKT